jgi:soluble lytic murein transglycosylase
VLLLIAPATAATAASEPDIERQRSRYLEADRLLRAGNLAAFQQVADELRDYPLYPYLRYNYIRGRLWKLRDDEVESFLADWSDLPTAGDIRRAWLKLLAERGHWKTFLNHYTPQTDPVLRCMQLNARLRTGNHAGVLDETRAIWLSGDSLPPQCDPAFEALYASDRMTDELVWARIRLAMENGKTGLARYLGNRLPPEQRPWVGRWIEVHGNPGKWTDNPMLPDSVIARRIMLHGMQRLATQNIDTAIARWPALRDSWKFEAEDVAALDRLLAVRAARARHKRVPELLDLVAVSDSDEELFHWRLRVALDTQDWDALLRWTSGTVPSAETMRGRWLYWRGRALEQRGDAEGARELFRVVAAERDYYGFMAADRLGVRYAINHRPVANDAESRRYVLTLPAIRRARELRALGMAYPARREWQHALQYMNGEQMQIAAGLAAEWGWHDRAIITMARAEAYDDLVVRFPLSPDPRLRDYAERRKLDPAWVMALVRAESAFMEDARSPAGALGLMQVMPATGRETARAIGLKNFAPDQLLRAETNIPIGTAYLRHMLDRFEGNMILATAAYNAGPGNISKWIPPAGCVEPDIWIERIPFAETRKYVQRILYYSSIYDWRLEQEVMPVRMRMAAVQPRKRDMVALLSCEGPAVSMR